MPSDDINILVYCEVLWRKRVLITLLVVMAAVGSTVWSFTIPPTFRSSAVIMPVGANRGGGLSALAGSFGGTAASLLGMSSSVSAQLFALLQARMLAERVIQDGHFMTSLFPNQELDLHKAALSVQQMMRFEENTKTMTITISAEATSPQLAHDLVSAYIAAMGKLISEKAFTQAKRYRLFIEGQVAKNKRDLLEAGKALNTFYKDGQVSSVESKVDVPIDFSATIEGDRSSFWERYAQLERDKSLIENRFNESGEKVIRGVPQQVYLQYLSLRRELLGQMSAMLARELEMAKMQEAKDNLTFEVVDPALLPHQRAKPNRRALVIMTTLVALFGSISFAFALEWLQKVKRARHDLELHYNNRAAR